MTTLVEDLRGAPRAWGLETALEGIVGLAALSGGLAMVFSPDGSALGLSTAMLAGGAFRDFLWPGVLLAGVIGGLHLSAAVLSFRQSAWATLASLLAGAALMVFVTVEVLLMRERSFLQPTLFAIGLAIVLLALPRAAPKAA